jgi:anti-sigma-K factor RskA
VARAERRRACCKLLLAFTLLTRPAPSTQFLVVLVAPNSQAAGWVVQASDSHMIELIPLGQDAVPGMALQFWTKGEQWRAPVSLGLVKPGEPYRVRCRACHRWRPTSCSS